MRGTIVRALSGLYYVLSEGETFECRARGAFRNRKQTPLVGDEVEFGEGAVESILPRLNSFERPPVANVELMVIVAPVKDPEPSLSILDRVAIAAEKRNTEVLICVSKTDLADDGVSVNIEEHYRNAYPVLTVCAPDGRGVEELKERIRGRKTALAGPSGAGKSTLANALLGSERSATGEISERLRRGKNTTRHCELFTADGLMIFDTPGFTSFDIEDIASAELAGLYPDIARFEGGCRFADCRHISEPDCSVKAALERGEISPSRYDSYRSIYSELLETEKRLR